MDLRAQVSSVWAGECADAKETCAFEVCDRGSVAVLALCHVDAFRAGAVVHLPEGVDLVALGRMLTPLAEDHCFGRLGGRDTTRPALAHGRAFAPLVANVPAVPVVWSRQARSLGL